MVIEPHSCTADVAQLYVDAEDCGLQNLIKATSEFEVNNVVRLLMHVATTDRL